MTGGFPDRALLPEDAPTGVSRAAWSVSRLLGQSATNGYGSHEYDKEGDLDARI
jgi:hypothetical protein